MFMTKQLCRSAPRTSSTGSLNRLRPPRPSKQVCTGGHGQKKQVCKAEHGEPGLQETAAVPENVKQSRKRKTPAKKEKEEATPSKTFRTEEDTEDMDQVTKCTAANKLYVDSTVQSPYFVRVPRPLGFVSDVS